MQKTNGDGTEEKRKKAEKRGSKYGGRQKSWMGGQSRKKTGFGEI
jgi:hypothetical protein